MKKISIGIATYEEMQEYTKAVARGDIVPNPDDPKIWFTSLNQLGWEIVFRSDSPVCESLKASMKEITHD